MDDKVRRRERRKRNLLAKEVRGSPRFKTKVKLGDVYKRCKKVDLDRELEDEQGLCGD